MSFTGSLMGRIENAFNRADATLNAGSDPALEWLREQIRDVNQRIEPADVAAH